MRGPQRIYSAKLVAEKLIQQDSKFFRKFHIFQVFASNERFIKILTLALSSRNFKAMLFTTTQLVLTDKTWNISGVYRLFTDFSFLYFVMQIIRINMVPQWNKYFIVKPYSLHDVICEVEVEQGCRHPGPNPNDMFRLIRLSTHFFLSRFSIWRIIISTTA